MKILIVNKLIQTRHTKPEDLQYVEFYEEYNEIDGIMETKQYIPEWSVEGRSRFHQSDLKESKFEFIKWLQKIERDIEREEKHFKTKIEGIYLYDINIMVQGIIEKDDKSGFIDGIGFYPRYAFIKQRIK